MKAIVLEKAGGVENLHLSEIDIPQINDNEILIKTAAISLNPADVKPKYSDEMLNMIYGTERPLILGWDISGTITKVGKNVSQFKEGDRVFGMANFPGKGGAYAEYVSTPASGFAKISAAISFVDAAAATLAALTALQTLKGRIKEGDKVLIQGGSGGVGHFAVQIAKAMNTYVITTASGDNKEFVKSLGADELIDYKTQKFEEEVSNLDFVLDIFGGEILEKSMSLLKPEGILVSTLLQEIPEELEQKAKNLNVELHGIVVNSNSEDITTIASMLEAGTLKPHIHKLFPFEKMREAHTVVEKGGLTGKVVVSV